MFINRFNMTIQEGLTFTKSTNHYVISEIEVIINLFIFFRNLSDDFILKKIHGTGGGSTLVFYLNGFQLKTISNLKTSSFLVGISDAQSAFDMMYTSSLIRAGQVKYLKFDWSMNRRKKTLYIVCVFIYYFRLG